MEETRPFYRNPRNQAILLILAAGLIYFLTLGRQGEARDILLAGEIGYLSASNDGGIRVLGLQNRAMPVELGDFDTPGSARNMALQGSLLYVADGERGLRILNVLDPRSPTETGAIELPGDTFDVAIEGSYAYLAMGENGIAVVDVSASASPRFVSSMDTPGNAQALAARVVTLGSSDGSAPQATVTLVYVADGEYGVEIYNFQNPRQPVPLSSLDTPGNARDLILSGNYAIVADGRRGIQIIDVANPVLPVFTGAYDPGRTAVSIALVGSRLIAAEGEQGITVLELADPRAPVEVIHLDTPGNAQAATLVDALLYVADGKQGLNIYHLNALGGPLLVGSFESPGEATLGQLLGSLLAIARGQFTAISVNTWRTWLRVGFDLLLFVAVLFFWLAFFAQFVLPVRGLAERKKVIDRLLSYHLGAHGPAISIRNGVVKQRSGEKRRRGKGVALFDTASAGVFRNAHTFTTIAGPGVVFTEKAEYLAGTVDLHTQVRTIGPQEGEDPFAPQLEGETGEAYAERQNRRLETSAHTRDGVEVVPNITVVFRLNSRPGEGSTQFGFNPTAVLDAIYWEGVNPEADGPDNKRVSWTWLPARVAVDVWREYLQKYPLDELFSIEITSGQADFEEVRQTAYNRIVDLVRMRLVSPEVDEVDDTGVLSGRRVRSYEHALLSQRGIRVLSVAIRNLRFPKSVDQKLIEHWKATWLERARREARQIEHRLAQARDMGRNLAIKEFAISVSQNLGRHILFPPQSSAPSPGRLETLESLVEGTLRLIAQEEDLQLRLATQKNNLVEIVDWILKQAE